MGNPEKEDNNEASKVLPPNEKTFKHTRSYSGRIIYEYISPVVKAEDVIVLDPKNGNHPSNGKTLVYTLDIYS